MRLAFALTGILLVTLPATSLAQQPDTDSVIPVGTTEWMITAGPAFGVTIFHSSPGHRYFLQPISWGRVLSRPIGPGAVRGQFEWSVEVVPVFGQYHPEGTYGFGITPLLWRWNFRPRARVAPFAELAGGGLWTRNALPAQTTRANFTAHASYGIRYFVKPHVAFVASYRLHHISNGNRRPKNPGVNAHVVQVGVSLLRRH